jgi:MFS family permease
MSNKLQARIATKILFFMNGICYASYATRIPDLKDFFHLNDAQLGSILLVAPIGSLVALPLAGAIIDKFGSREITTLATVIYFLTMPFIGLATNTWQLMIALFFFGFGGDLLNIAMNVQAVGVGKIYGRTIMSSFHGVFSLGFMSGFAIGGIVSSLDFSVFKHLALCGTFMLVAGICTYQFLLTKDSKPDEPQPLFALPDKSLMLLSIICLCAMLGEGAMADWSVLYFKALPSNKTTFITAASTAFSIMMVVGRFMGDWLTSKIGIKRTLLLNSVLYAFGMIIALFYPTPLTVIIGFGVTGLGLSTIVPLCYAEAGHSNTMAAGMALAAISTVGIAGFLLGPPLIGYISQATNLRIALGLLIILGIVCSVFTRFIRDE